MFNSDKGIHCTANSFVINQSLNSEKVKKGLLSLASFRRDYKST